METLTPRTAVEFAVQTEELGAIFYDRLARKFADDDEINEIFSFLAEDEVAHGKQFERLLASLPPDRDEADAEERRELLELISRSQFFTGERGLYRELDAIHTREDALARALRLERDVLAYYRGMRHAFGASPVLDELIETERGHVNKLVEYMITGARMRGLGTAGAERAEG